MSRDNLYGAVAEFETPAELMDACYRIREYGYTCVDACTPFPVHGLDKALGQASSKMPWIVLGGAVTGFLLAVGMQVWMNAINYPIKIAGKPYASLPAFLPVTFELTVLLSAFAAVFGMFAINGLPRFHHPLFGHSNFKRATDDRFFLVVESKDPLFAPGKTAEHLGSVGGKNVEEVES
jgi:hypothetical protein